MDFALTWVNMLRETLLDGALVAPRGKLTKEILHRSIVVDMRKPVLTVPHRKINYKFMAAEAFWILSGDNKVETISPYNPNIAQFSDDGVTFYGAYGPKIMSQLPDVISKLEIDPDSRQAGLTIWRENPPQTKDVPCTVAIFFSIRKNILNVHVFMRSSDIWLGVPYDVFNFSMLGHYVCACLNKFKHPSEESSFITPGALFLTAASSHIYQPNWDAAQNILDSGYAEVIIEQNQTPKIFYQNALHLMGVLARLRVEEKNSHLRWWVLK